MSLESAKYKSAITTNTLNQFGSNPRILSNPFLKPKQTHSQNLELILFASPIDLSDS